MTFPEFQAKWTNPPGQRVDFDHVFQFQCVDLILQYIYETKGISVGVRGNAIDYWNSTSPALLTKFTKEATSEVRPGDIAVLSSPYTTYGHIGIATGVMTGDKFEMLEQNGATGEGTGTGGDSIRLRFVSRARIVGVLRPIPDAPAIPMVSLDRLTQLYREILKREPDVSGIQHYVGHYTEEYVRNDLTNSNDRKSLEAAEAAALAARAAAEAEAARIAAQKQAAPAGALPVPTSTEKYPIKTNLKIYSSKTDAQNRINPKGEIQPGALWYLYFEQDGIYNITQTPGATANTWINPSDNVEQPIETTVPIEVKPVIKKSKPETPETIRKSFLPIMPDRSPIECQIKKNVLVIDLLGKGKPISAKTGRFINVYGTFEAAGRVYALVKIKNEQTRNNYMYGIPIASHDNLGPFLDDIYKVSDHIKKSWELIYDKLYQSIDGIFKVLTKK